MSVTELKQPNSVIEARKKLDNLRRAEAEALKTLPLHQREAEEKKNARIAAEKDALVGGKPVPAQAAFDSREAVEKFQTTEAVIASLREDLKRAEGELDSAYFEWGMGLLSAQLDEDGAKGRDAVKSFANSLRELVSAWGEHGLHLVNEMIAALPREVRYSQTERLSRFNGIFSSGKGRSPADRSDWLFGEMLARGLLKKEQAVELLRTSS